MSKLFKCPWSKGTNYRRHWLDGWNWFVEGKRRATADKEFFAGWKAAEHHKNLYGSVPRRDEY